MRPAVSASARSVSAWSALGKWGAGQTLGRQRGGPPEEVGDDVARRIAGGLAAAWGVSCGLVSAAFLVAGLIRKDAGIAFGLVGLLISFLVLRWSVRKLRTR